MTSNFEFLNRYWPALFQLGSLAEKYLFSDPNACIFKLGAFGERVVDEIFQFENLVVPGYDDSQAARVKVLKQEGLLPQNVDDILYTLRQKRNRAVHAYLDDLDEAKNLLPMVHKLGVWFMEVYGDWGYIAPDFVMPEQEEEIDWASRYEQLRSNAAAARNALQQKDQLLQGSKEQLAQQTELLQKREAELKAQEQLIADLTAQISAVQTAASAVSREERAAHGEQAAAKAGMTEAETRMLIDQQLRDAGWEADTINLRYSKGTRPVKGKNLAIAEWPTAAMDTGNHGRADYALFIGLKLYGIVEAKRTNKGVSAILDHQCREYACMLRSEHFEYSLGTWGFYKVPFLFATNGRKYLKQWETESGIWFRDARRDTNLGRALQGWISPEGLQQMYEADIAAADTRLENTPYDLLRDPNGLNLRYYQINAIEAAEKAIIHGARTALLAMATGTGKTRTVLGMIYRFLSSNRFRRILFVVDRNALGEQAEDVFKEAKIQDLMTLDNIYSIKGLGETAIDKETRVQVATVQSLVRRILNPDEGGKRLTVSDYDLIIVDEAHRGYLLDQEMSDAEVLYRDETDYISKYRMVIDYFDAVKIALTATPALHTTQIFGDPVFTYSYREAVIDGYLVDHDAPHNIITKLRQEGIHYNRGEQIVMIDPVTGEVLNAAQLEDEMKFDVDAFNRKVITESFNRTVLQEIVNRLDPDSGGKTLIFAVDDKHADMIVQILRELVQPLGYPSEMVAKITGSIGDQEVIKKAIREFKNEHYPNIVVTVDLLTTGVDVPKITSLVFLRRIRSRILFEQMLGRATRLCPEINKTHFEIYDAVGVYEALDSVSTMKAQHTYSTFEQLLQGLEALTDDAHVQAQIDTIAAKLRRKSHHVSADGAERFRYLSEFTLEGLAAYLRSLGPQDAKAAALEDGKKQAMILMDSDYVARPGGKVVDFHEDELISHTRGYGNGMAPEDYIEAFKEYITTHMNEIAALRILCTRPADLTREGLKSLKLELDLHHFDEKQLNSAWKAVSNQEITADIIAFVRQQALGSVLISHEERVKKAFERIRKAHAFNGQQLGWLARIEKTMLQEPVLDKSIFDLGAFKTNGGFTMIDKRFGGKLSEIIREINTYIYDDGGMTA